MAQRSTQIYIVNSDWAVTEPVDVEDQPVPPAQQSRTLLVSNLANRVQPILRYDLGDSVLQRPDRCPCGNPVPAIHIQRVAVAATRKITPARPSEMSLE